MEHRSICPVLTGLELAAVPILLSAAVAARRLLALMDELQGHRLRACDEIPGETCCVTPSTETAPVAAGRLDTTTRAMPC